METEKVQDLFERLQTDESLNRGYNAEIFEDKNAIILEKEYPIGKNEETGENEVYVEKIKLRIQKARVVPVIRTKFNRSEINEHELDVFMAALDDAMAISNDVEEVYNS